MEQKINDIVIEHFGLSVFIVCVVIIIGIVLLVWWCSKLYHKIDAIDKLPCNLHQQKMSEHDNAVTRIDTSLSFLSKELETALRIFQRNTNADSFTQTQSPLSITPKGEEMIKRLEIDKMFDENWERINSLIKNGVASITPYDVDRFCLEQAVVFPENFLSEGQINILKEDAYESGLLLTPYMKVIAILSRDRFLREHGLLG